MPKENTHLYFAHELLAKLNQDSILKVIQEQEKAYYFGSVAPDSFYYSDKEAVRKISEHLHGRKGNLTNEIVFKLLDQAKAGGNQADLAFIFGYLTHCALDMAFHPVIYYLSGNYYDPDPKKADEAVYLHRHLETYLDAQVNQTFYFNDYVNYNILRSLDFTQTVVKDFGVSQDDIVRALKRKAAVFRLLRNNMALDFLYLFYRFVKHSSWSKFKRFLGIFYGNLKRDDRTIPNIINYRDVVTGEPKVTTIYDLFQDAGALAVELLAAANAYYSGQIGREEAAAIIRGESLNTGRLGIPVEEIRYFFDPEYERRLPSLPKAA